MLTRSSWIKIAAIALLCLCVCAGIGSCSFGCTPLVRGCTPMPNAPTWTADMYPNAGNARIDGSQVRNITLDWFAGRVDVDIVDGEGEEIVLEESASQRELDDSWRLRWALAGDTLQIVYWETSTALSSCSGFDWPAKALTMTIPRSVCEHLGTFSIDAFSGDYNLDGLSCDALDIELASGRVDGSSVAFDRVDVEVASGLLNLDGRIADELSLEMASGTANIACAEQVPGTMGVSLASGNVTLTMPSDAGITANVSKLSGLFSFDMPDPHTYDDSYICGDGSSILNVEMTSGNVTVRS